jgi:hypothetical protein
MHAPSTTAATSPADGKVTKSTAAELMKDTSTGLERDPTRRMPGYLTPTRSAPCPTL